MKKYELYRAERDRGLTYQQIADKYGVSRQNIHLACRNYNPLRFHPFDEKRCVYSNLRKWLNANKISANELMAKLGYEAAGRTSDWLRNVLKGKCDIKKNVIDKLIMLTGLTYEQLFEV